MVNYLFWLRTGQAVSFAEVTRNRFTVSVRRYVVSVLVSWLPVIAYPCTTVRCNYKVQYMLSGADLGARQPISCYYYACDLCYFDVVLCHSSRQILATNAQISFSRKPRPPQCSLASLGRVLKVTPSKNPINPPMAMTILYVRPSVRLYST